MEKKNIFQKKQFVVIFALIAMFVWGCAYPFIKLGMLEWNIANDDAGGKMLFAGVRFTTAGILTLLIAKVKKQEIIIRDKTSIMPILLFGLFNTALHYFFFYSGLAYCEGGKASIINSLSPFILIILATIIFKEKMTVRKITGCILGFLGIVIVNLGTDMSGFAFRGEGMIILNCICSAIGGVFTRIVTKKVPAITATGYSLSLGGIMLVVTGLITGGRLNQVTFNGILLLLGLIAISMIGFILYNQLICYNPISEIAIFNALIPVFGTMMSCIMLGEAFGIKNLLGLICTSVGIAVLHLNVKGEGKVLRRVAIGIVCLALIIGAGIWFATENLRETERKNKEDPVYQQVMKEKAEKEKLEKEKLKKEKTQKEKTQKEKTQKEKTGKSEKKSDDEKERSFKVSSGAKYTEDKLEKILQSDKNLSTRIDERGGYICKKYWFTNCNWDDDICFDELSYYLYEDKKSAQNAYDNIKEDWFESIEESGSNYVLGWEADVMDAEIELYMYRVDNLIIMAEIHCMSEWADGEDNEVDAVSWDYRIDFIKDNF